MVTISTSFLKRLIVLCSMSEKRIEEKILSQLKKKQEQNILEISSTLKLDRHTTAKYLEILRTKGIVDFKTKGKSKLWSLTNNPFTELLGKTDFVSNQVLNILSALDYEVSIQSKNYDIIWHNRSKETGKCYQVLEGKKTRCKNCPSQKVFETGQPQKTKIKKDNQEKTRISQPIKNENGDVIAVVELTRNEK